MKYSILKSLFAIGFLASLLTFLSSCKKNHDPNPVPTISSFTPTSGMVGATVTINGTNFGSSIATNVVKFNGTTAVVTAATSTQITTTIPAGATTGKITVATAGSIATSADNFTVIYQPTLESFSPTSGGVGSTILLVGTNFSPTVEDNIVKFNGVVATVHTADDSQLTVDVPGGATTGKISVTVFGLTATSADDFTVYPMPTVTVIDPDFYQTGTALPVITINGTNFSSVAAENVVKFNGISATVSNATTTQLTLTLPAGVSTGKVTVTVHELTATSLNNFLVGCPDVIIQDIAVSNLVSNTFTVTYHIKNIGTIPLDINYMYLQAYVATEISTSTPGVQDQGAGGFGRYGCCGTTEPLLQPNEVREMVNTSVNGSGHSIVTYPYVILQVLPDVGGPTECNGNNNELGVKIQP